MNDFPIKVNIITYCHELEEAFRIRRTVFVDEQKVKMDEEFDEFENCSEHLLAYYQDLACGTCRWRFTDSSVKMERFAVLSSYRNMGVASKLLINCLESIKNNPRYKKEKEIYLNAQVNAISFYEKFGFEKIGTPFYECKIEHLKMVY